MVNKEEKELFDNSETINAYIEDEISTSYLNYAYSVITGRAIPDVYDGIKPVQRRILYAMAELALWHDKPTKKSARIVGEVLGKYHPHGDTSVYMALVKMAQDFHMRYPLIIGQGNFGSIDDDPPAAMRYTEAKLSKIAEFMLEDLDKETVEFKPNFDDTLKEPKVLPGKFPNLICNGSSGIAVGLATDIPPHNYKEVANAIIAYINNNNLTLEEIMKYIPGPDFPTGGILTDKNSIKEVYEKGYGSIELCGKIIEEEKGGHKNLVIVEIPYRVVKSKLVEEITNLYLDTQNKYSIILRGIKEIRDESSKQGIRIVIELFKDANIDAIKTALFNQTSLKVKIKVNMTALVKNHPRTLTLRDLIINYVDYRREIIIKRTQFDLNKALNRIHIVEGLIIALDNIDEVIKIIKSSADTQKAKENLMKRFKLTEIQSDAILDMKLQKLTSLETNKLKEEKIELGKLIKNLQEILKNPKKRDEIIIKELEDMGKVIGDERKTQFGELDVEEIHTEELISNDPVLLTISKKGFIIREIDSSLKIGSRNTKGRRSEATDINQFEKDDYILITIAGYLKDTFLFITDQGRVYSLKGYEIKGDVSGKITRSHLKNIERLKEIDNRNENITTVLSVDKFLDDQYILFMTKLGKVAKIKLSEFENINRNGINGIKLKEGDSVVSAIVTDGNMKLFLVKKNGKGLKFNENLIPINGRGVGGVKATTVNSPDNQVIGMDIAYDDKYVVFVTKDGKGRKLSTSKIPEFSNRGGKGYKIAEFGKSRELADFVLCDDNDALIITTIQGRRITIEVNKLGENLLKLIDLNEGDYVASLSAVKISG